MIKFKKYQESEFKNLARCMEQLQDFLITIDNLKRLRKLANYGNTYTKNLLKKVNKHNGLVLLAYNKEKIIGCIAGIIEKQEKNELRSCVSKNEGRILELFIMDDYRARGIGQKLMKQMEIHFKQNNCDVVRVEVFEPNKAAHNFYNKLNYKNRAIDMIKVLKQQNSTYVS